MAKSAGLEYAVFDTRLGWMAAAASDKGLVELVLPQPTAEGALASLSKAALAGRENEARFQSLAHELRDYMSGKAVSFQEELDLTRATPFQRRVWQQTRQIPCGQSRSYGWIAKRLGQPGACRAVGQALGRNPLPVVIPCHRVLASDGSLGGFSGGLSVKRRLLELEGIAVT